MTTHSTHAISISAMKLSIISKAAGYFRPIKRPQWRGKLPVQHPARMMIVARIEKSRSASHFQGCARRSVYSNGIRAGQLIVREDTKGWTAQLLRDLCFYCRSRFLP